jgi:type IV pilus assembly protein PilY1
VIGDVFVINDHGQRSRQVGVRGRPGRQRLSHVRRGRQYAFRVNGPANWTITKIASLGCGTVSACSANRKFMFMPDSLR